jgi:hypothetical protein
MKELIQDNLEITHVNEEAYLNELVAYRLQVEGYMYDQFHNKLVEIFVTVSHNFHMCKQQL